MNLISIITMLPKPQEHKDQMSLDEKGTQTEDSLGSKDPPGKYDMKSCHDADGETGCLYDPKRATLAEKEVTSLKEQLSNQSGGGCSTGAVPAVMAPPPPEREESLISSSHHKNVDYELAAKDKEIASLVEDVQRLQASLNQLRETNAVQIRMLQEKLEQKHELINRLETKLDAQRDYEDMRRELLVLKEASANNNNSTTDASSLNGIDVKDTIKDKRQSSPQPGLLPRYSFGPGGLPVEAFGSLLGEEFMANWRRSLERSLLASSPPSHASIPHHPLSSTPNNRDQSCCPSPQESVGNESSIMLNDSVSSIVSSLQNDNNGGGAGAGLLNGASSLGASDRLPFRFEDSLIPKSDPMEGRLQEMLRYNMDKYASQCLDTLQIARRVRELLSIHNIGQRLFAKYVLGLSQGTVSELLSKPKPWDKLTEKGRDSYRKMHSWAADEGSILLLKSLIPKKGKESTGGSMATSFDSSADDRIAHILSEANQALRAGVAGNNNNANASGSTESLCDEVTSCKSPGNGSNGNNNGITNISTNGKDLSSNGNPCSNNTSNSSNNNTNIGNTNNNSGGNGNGSNSASNNNNNAVNNGCNTNNGQCPPSPSGSTGRERRFRKYENDDIPQEQVNRIYQEELAKLIALRLPPTGDDPRASREHFPNLLFPHIFGSSLLDRDDIRMAFDAYQRELAKLAVSTSSSSPSPFPSPLFQPGGHLPNGLGGPQDLTIPKRMSPMDSKESDDKSEKDDASENVRHSGSAFSLVRPKGSESSSGAASPLNSILPPSGPDDSVNASPLQRMASITNSLISQPAAPSTSSPNQKPLKAVLPPITQQQFDQYTNLNTEDIVRKVKEQLSQYSISQRLFGESVLGLSQGSVSDLLARPKPWHMLTQKGREPFIRMNMFLEDENAVHKLVASQYKIAPEKLMRTGGYAGNPSPVSGSKPTTKMSELPKSLERSLERSMERNMEKSMESSPLPPPPPPVPSITQTNLSLGHDLVKKSPTQSHTTNSSQAAVMSRPPPPSSLPQQPSVYEMAALTQDLDTQIITTKIKEALLANNIGQKIFGEAVLGLSQGSVSELLSKPKPWHMLSIKGREPFIRMQLWLSDPMNVERLQHLKNERREANKRKRGMPHATSPLESYSAHGSSDNSNDSPDNAYSPSGNSTPSAPPNKKQRVLFSDEQKEALKLAFALDPYPNVSAIEFLARELGLSSRTITNWFHNHRMRLKQQTSSMVQDSNLSSQPFDPVQFRLLLHQRMVEMHKDKFPGFQFMSHAQTPNTEEGLDLTVSSNVSRTHSDNEVDYFEEGDYEDDDNDGSVASEESCNSGGSKDVRSRKRKHPSKSLSSLDFTKSSHPIGKASSMGNSTGSSGSSRRKPVAPQWFNPSWHDDSEDEEVLINGVCVMQNALGLKPHNVKETLQLGHTSPYNEGSFASGRKRKSGDFTSSPGGARSDGDGDIDDLTDEANVHDDMLKEEKENAQDMEHENSDGEEEDGRNASDFVKGAHPNQNNNNSSSHNYCAVVLAEENRSEDSQTLLQVPQPP